MYLCLLCVNNLRYDFFSKMMNLDSTRVNTDKIFIQKNRGQKPDYYQSKKLVNICRWLPVAVLL